MQEIDEADYTNDSTIEKPTKTDKATQISSSRKQTHFPDWKEQKPYRQSAVKNVSQAPWAICSTGPWPWPAKPPLSKNPA